MRAIRSARFVLWLGCVLAYFAATYAADRSPANMANAANKFLSSLTPEQKQVAAFAFDNGAERERFGFVPTEMHPRVGLTIEKMTPPQREAAHNLLKAGLSQKGYMTTTSIMELETHLERDRESAGLQPAEARAQSAEVFRLGVRHAERQGHVGLEGRRAPRVAELHDRERQHGLVGAALLRIEPGGSDGRPEEGTARPRLRRRSRPRAA